MNEIKPRETINAMKIIEDNFNHLIKQIETLERTLELTEKRALEWEQMHLEQCEINKQLRAQNPTATLARLEELTKRDQEYRFNYDTRELEKRDAHNKLMQEQTLRQSDLMRKNHELMARQLLNGEEVIRLNQQVVANAEKQTEIFSKMLGVFDHIAGKMR